MPYLLHLSFEPSLPVCYIQTERCSIYFRWPLHYSLCTLTTPQQKTCLFGPHKGNLVPHQHNVSMSSILLEPELFMLLSLLGAEVLLTDSKSELPECWNLITLLYSTSCYKELKSSSPFGAHYERVLQCLLCRNIHVSHKEQRSSNTQTCCYMLRNKVKFHINYDTVV